MSDDWTALEYKRQKKKFVESRLIHRSVHLHASLIFAGTLGTGWVCSWALMKLGWWNLPLRYAASFALSYAVFLVLVRLWADLMRQERSGDDWSNAIDGLDMLSGDAEGCFVVLAVWSAGLLAAAVFAMIGGMPLLLEVAFEVVFAGVVVRRARRIQVVGDWLGALLARTWIPAAVTAFLLICIAAYLQHKVPEARTLREALKVLIR